jgi:hypothetical protein
VVDDVISLYPTVPSLSQESCGLDCGVDEFEVCLLEQFWQGSGIEYYIQVFQNRVVRGMFRK